MHIVRSLLVCHLSILAGMASDDSPTPWHTAPDKWTEPRIYHAPFDEEIASHISLDRCAVPDTLPERHLADNHAYWFATIHPDRTRTNSGPWNTEVLVYNERDYLVRIQLRNTLNCHVGWVNEKLLRIRVWWGRICATDLIIDVERERIIYKEMAWWGAIAFQQFQEAKKQSQPDGSANESQPIRSETNTTPSAAGSRR